MKYIVMTALVLFSICVWNDTTPSEAVNDVGSWISNWSGDVSNTMEGGFND